MGDLMFALEVEDPDGHILELTYIDYEKLFSEIES
jgi:YD repeat-containing protein